MLARTLRIAEKGDLSIRVIVDHDIGNQRFNLDPLISELYTWGNDPGLVGRMRPQMTARVQPTYPAMSAAMIKT